MFIINYKIVKTIIKLFKHIIQHILGWLIFTWTGLYYIWALKIPLGLSLFDFPVLNNGFETLSDLAWTPIEDVVSYVWFTCQRFWWVGSLGPFGTDQLGLFGIPLVFDEFYGWYDPGPTI